MAIQQHETAPTVREGLMIVGGLVSGWRLHTVACRLAFSRIGKLIFEATLRFDRLATRILDIIKY